MTHTQKRKIIVDDIRYEWCIRGNDIYVTSSYITIYKPKISGTPIYLDPFPHGLEIRPRVIADVIRFALNKNWKPEQKGSPLKIGFVKNEFVILPEGIENSYEYEKSAE